MASTSPPCPHRATRAIRPASPPRRVRGRGPTWNVQVPSAETAAIAVIGIAEAANLAGYANGTLAGGAVGLSVVGFLIKKCIKRIH